MEEKVRKQKLKRWLTFAVRWGIAVAGIYIVLANISFYDRVQVLDPATNAIHKLRVLNNAAESDSQFLVQPLEGGPPKRLTHFAAEHVSFFAQSRDGKNLAVTRGDSTSAVVLISNVK